MDQSLTQYKWIGKKQFFFNRRNFLKLNFYGKEIHKFFMCIFFAIGITVSSHGVEFDDYKPDKAGKKDVSGLLSKALIDTSKTDKALRISSGKYLIGKPVKLPPYISVIGTPGATILKGANRNVDIFHAWRNANNYLRGLSFQSCHKALTCEGDGYLGTSRVVDCSFINCRFGIDFPCIQIASFTRCSFYKCDYGIRGLRGYGGRSNFVNVFQCSFRDIGEWSLEIEGSPTNIRDSDFEGSAGGGIHIMDAMVATIEGCYFEALCETKNEDICISAKHFYNGIVTIRNNQFNLSYGDDRILIEGDSGAHIYDNFIFFEAGQTIINSRPRIKNIRIGKNYIETKCSLNISMSEKKASNKAAVIVQVKTLENLTKQKVDIDKDKLEIYKGKFLVSNQIGGKSKIKVEPGKVIEVYFCVDNSLDGKKFLPTKEEKIILYLDVFKEPGKYRALKITK